MKEALRGAFGIVGVIIYFIFAYGIAFYPLIFIAMPWWLCAILSLLLTSLKPIYSSIGTLILYVIALLSVTVPSIDVWEIFLFIFAGLFLLLEAIPNTVRFVWAYRSIKNEQVFYYDPNDDAGHQS